MENSLIFTKPAAEIPAHPNQELSLNLILAYLDQAEAALQNLFEVTLPALLFSQSHDHQPPQT